MFSEDELASINQLLVPHMGTELLAPLLHFLVRYVWAERVIEAGAGYTTPYICKALLHNRYDFLSERAALLRKSREYLVERELWRGAHVDAVRVEHSMRPRPAKSLPERNAFAQRRYEWLKKPPSWASPSYYLRTFEPALTCVDDLSAPLGSAKRVASVLSTLGLRNLVTFLCMDFRSFCAEWTPSIQGNVDLIWVDLHIGVDDLLSLIEGDLWRSLRPTSGLLLIHGMQTTRGGQFLTREIKRRLNLPRCDVEYVGILQPHRILQGDFIILRKNSQSPAPVDEILEAGAESLLERDSDILIERLPRTP